MGGQESVSDIDEEDIQVSSKPAGNTEYDMDFEVVPQTLDVAVSADVDMSSEEEEEEEGDSDISISSAPETPEPPATRQSKLKDLFAPREEEEGKLLSQ